ncbi:lipolytic enzyme [Roridomyces roridus]|uniref:Lipolytic enzyme n=1 Tax=Roridomyces roridus TaxID=1738132 RepID=A0AAD7BMU9_9AGAR|nr:lipolytic enzyme [Roridomyces roridus]
MQFLLQAVLLSLSGLAFAQSAIYGQCGGIGWTGATTCVSGTTCQVLNSYYSQCLPGAVTTPTSPPTTTTGTTTSSAPSSTATGLNIRLLPLGDSITFGLTSTDGNGYRNTLHNLLSPGNTVDFIGSLKAGTMADNDNEGHSGFTITQIAGTASNALALPARPNVVLLLAGTNDMAQGITSSAPTNLQNLINQIFTACPDATLVVANLPALPLAQAAVNTYNTQVASIVSTQAAAGKHILLADMASVIMASDLTDGVHPTNAGYVKMGNAWFPVIQQAIAKGWIKAPVNV